MSNCYHGWFEEFWLKSYGYKSPFIYVSLELRLFCHDSSESRNSRAKNHRSVIYHWNVVMLSWQSELRAVWFTVLMDAGHNSKLSGSVVYSRWINHSAICETQICSINSLVKFVYTSIMPYGKRSIVRFLFQLVIESSSVTLLLFWDTVYRCSIFGTIFWFWRGNLSLWVVCPGTCMTSITVSMITVSDIDI